MDTAPHQPPSAATWEQQTLQRARNALAAGALYFLALVLAGWVFGPIRGFYVHRGLDPLLAVLAEAPLMILVMVFASRAIVRMLRVRDRAEDRLVMGSFAVLLVLAAEFAGGALVRGWGFYETLANLTTRPGSVLLVLLAVALVVPVAHRGEPRV